MPTACKDRRCRSRAFKQVARRLLRCQMANLLCLAGSRAHLWHLMLRSRWSQPRDVQKVHGCKPALKRCQRKPRKPRQLWKVLSTKCRLQRRLRGPSRLQQQVQEGVKQLSSRQRLLWMHLCGTIAVECWFQAAWPLGPRSGEHQLEQR